MTLRATTPAGRALSLVLALALCMPSQAQGLVRRGGSADRSTPDAGPGVLPQAPRNLRYAPPQAVVPEGLAIAPLVPQVDGGRPAAFALAAGSSLPAGLALDPITGAVSGIPLAPEPPRAVTIIAANAGGASAATVTIEVFGVAPQAFSYTPGALVLELGGGPYTAVPHSAGGPVDLYALPSGSLPPGLFLDPLRGLVTGTPTAPRPLTVLHVVASNETGSASTPLQIEVRFPAPPSGLSYPSGPHVLGLAPIAPIVPGVSGRVDAFSVTPSLPNRLLNVSGGSVQARPGVLLPHNAAPIDYRPPEQSFVHPWETLNVWLPAGQPPLSGWPCVLANTSSGYHGAPPLSALDPADAREALFTRLVNAGFAIVVAGTVTSGPFSGWFVPPGHASGRWEDPDAVMPEKDVLHALQWAKTQTSFPIDPQRVFLHGVSSGATLAAWVALGPELGRPGGSAQRAASSRVAGVLCFDVLTSFPAYRSDDGVVAHHWESVSTPGLSASSMGDADPALLDAGSVARVLLDPLCNGATTPVLLAYDCSASAIDFSNDADGFPKLRGALGPNVHDLWHGAKLWERLEWLNKPFHAQKSAFLAGAGMAGSLGSMASAPTGSFSGTALDSTSLHSAAVAWLTLRAREAIPDPSGLQLHPKSGRIHGTPNQTSLTAGYTVRATSPGGSTTTVLSLRVSGG